MYHNNSNSGHNISPADHKRTRKCVKRCRSPVADKDMNEGCSIRRKRRIFDGLYGDYFALRQLDLNCSEDNHKRMLMQIDEHELQRAFSQFSFDSNQHPRAFKRIVQLLKEEGQKRYGIIPQDALKVKGQGIMSGSNSSSSGGSTNSSSSNGSNNDDNISMRDSFSKLQERQNFIITRSGFSNTK